MGWAILVTEDNEVNRKVAGHLLEHLGYQADFAVDGSEAVAAVDRRDYDLVLMDLQMPVMDGLEATRRIRARQGRQPHIAAMTAHAVVGDRERCLDAGMDDYLSKPLQIEQLVAALERVPMTQAAAKAS